jgi:thiol-disulfide isomerase/thioredoxin
MMKKYIFLLLVLGVGYLQAGINDYKVLNNERDFQNAQTQIDKNEPVVLIFTYKKSDVQKSLVDKLDNLRKKHDSVKIYLVNSGNFFGYNFLKQYVKKPSGKSDVFYTQAFNNLLNGTQTKNDTQQTTKKTTQQFEAGKVTIISDEVKYQAVLDLIQNKEPVILVFTATWCGFCQKFKPIYQEAAKKYPQVHIFEIEHTQAYGKQLAGKYGVRAYPTQMLYVNAKEQTQKYGEQRGKEAFENVLKRMFADTEKK